MPKLTLTDLTQLSSNETSAVTSINNNNTAIETAMENTLSRDGSTPNTMSADIDLNSNKVINVANPTNNQDAVTKAYGDTNYGGAASTAAAASAAAALVSETNAAASAASAAASAVSTAADVILAEDARDAAQAAANGIKWKDSVKVSTTTNITLSGEQTIDGVLTSNNRVLVKNQTAQEENGVYVTATGAWTRATPSDTWSELVSMAVTVEEGTSNSDTVWICSSDDGGTLGTTPITFAQIGGGDLRSVNNLSDVASAATSFNNIKQAATDTATGVVEIATQAEVDAGTDTVRVVTPATLDKYRTESFVIACSDETSDLIVGTSVATFRMPYAFTLTDVRASVGTAPTGAVVTVDINEAATTILSTKITIDASEKTSTTAVTAPVISDTSLADDAEITIDIDQVGSTIAGAGLKVTLIGYPT